MSNAKGWSFPPEASLREEPSGRHVTAEEAPVEGRTLREMMNDLVRGTLF